MTGYPKTTKFSPPDILSQFERSAVEAHITALDIPISKAVSDLRVYERSLSGAGSYIEFEPPDHKWEDSQKHEIISTARISADIPNLKYGVGFVLYLYEMKFVSLEIHPYAENFPDKISAFHLYLDDKLIAEEA